jgi:hypothetical protein
MSILQHYIKIHSVYRYARNFPTVANIQEALSLVMRNNIKSEMIGHWLYCFTNALIGCQLEAAGFWFSFKHRAYVYSGRQKDFPAFDESLDEIRARLGNQQVERGFCK